MRLVAHAGYNAVVTDQLFDYVYEQKPMTEVVVALYSSQLEMLVELAVRFVKPRLIYRIMLCLNCVLVSTLEGESPPCGQLQETSASFLNSDPFTYASIHQSTRPALKINNS